MPDRVHPSMQDVQAPALDPVTDRAPAEAQRKQLRSGNDSVLALGEAGDRAIRPTLGPYDGLDVGCIAHPDDGAGETVTALPRSVTSA